MKVMDNANTSKTLVVGTTFLAAVGAYIWFKFSRTNKLLEPTSINKNHFLNGNYGPIRSEVSVNLLPLIEGEIPKDIDGMFIRNGPNPQFEQDPDYHWFEGDGMLHGVRIANGEASYRNRYIETESYTAEKKAEQSIYGPFFNLSGITGLVWILWNVLKNKIGLQSALGKSTANTSVVYHAGYFLALMEADNPFWVLSQSLTTIGRFNYDGKLNHSFTAHPKVDVTTGEMMFFGYSTNRVFHYAIVDKHGVKQPSVEITLPKPVMMHDFAITEKYSIFLDLPYVFDIKNAFKGKTFYNFEKDSKSRIGVLPRHSTSEADIKWFEVDTCFVFHTANAWDDENEVVLVAARYPELILNKLGAVNLHPTLYMWRLNMNTGRVVEKFLDNREDVEFPTINENLMGKKTRFIYTAWIGSSVGKGKGVIKYDMHDDRNHKYYQFTPNEHGGEFVFIEKTKASTEDDGWLISFVFNDITNSSSLLILNAKDLSLQARVCLPQRVPFGFHGKWLTKEMLLNEKSPVSEEWTKYHYLTYKN